MLRRYRGSIIAIAVGYLSLALTAAHLMGHLERFGDADLTFDTIDASSFRILGEFYAGVADQRPVDELIAMRPWVYPLFIGTVDRIAGIWGLIVIQLLLNVITLVALHLAIRRLTSSWLFAWLGTVFVALTPSFTLLAWRGLSESLALALASLVILAFSASETLSYRRIGFVLLSLGVLATTRGIFVPLWITAVLAALVWVVIHRDWSRLAWVAPSFVPIAIQLLLSYSLLGQPGLASTGRYNIDGRFFPLVWGHAELGEPVWHSDSLAVLVRQEHPHLSQQLGYLVSHLPTTIRVYGDLLLNDHLTANTSFTRTPRLEVMQGQRWWQWQIEYFSRWMNIAFAVTHVLILGALVFMLVRRRLPHWRVLALCGAAALLILPAPLTYWQGDRIIIAAMPFWIVAYAVMLARMSRWPKRN